MSNQYNKNNASLLHIATLGRSVGLKGDIKFHINSDFPEQFHNGAEFILQNGTSVRLENVNDARGTVKIAGCNSVEEVKRFTNAKLYTTYDATRETCDLEEDEYFWFDVVGCMVYEEGQKLGSVMEIERIGVQDYLEIKTDELLVAQGESKTFLLPYQDPFILSTDIDAKSIEVSGALDILQAS